MKTTEVGKRAENIVAETLRAQGHTVLDQNWRTRRCEIDIVSTHKKTVYFIEVKYRGSLTWGDGFEYIGEKKQQQMQFAAEMWIAHHAWSGAVSLMAASVNDKDEVDLVLL